MTKRDARDIIGVSGQGSHRTPGRDTPQAYGVVITRRGQIITAWTESDAPDAARVALQRGLGSPGLKIPQLHRLISTG